MSEQLPKGCERASPGETIIIYRPSTLVASDGECLERWGVFDADGTWLESRETRVGAIDFVNREQRDPAAPNMRISKVICIVCEQKP